VLAPSRKDASTSSMEEMCATPTLADWQEGDLSLHAQYGNLLPHPSLSFCSVSHLQEKNMLELKCIQNLKWLLLEEVKGRPLSH